MRKGWIVFLTVVLTVALAAPAMADLKVSGFYRAKAMLSSFFDGSGGPSVRTDAEKQSNSYVESRGRIKFEMGTKDVKAVFFFESDMTWGVGSGNAYVTAAPGNVSNTRNGGGALSADSTQLETKNVYVWFKIPDTSISAKVGMQGVGDAYAGIFSNSADMTGIFFSGKFEPVKWTVGWAKLYETNGGGGSGGYDASDDVALYLLAVDFAPAKDMNLGLNFYYLQDDSGKNDAGMGRLDPFQGVGGGPSPLNGYKVDVYMPGVNFAMKTGPAKISGFAFYQTGTAKSTVAGVSDMDISAYVVDARGDIKVGPGSVFVEGLYVSGGDEPGNTKYKAPITLGDYQRGTSGAANDGTGGNSGFGHTHMYFLFGYDSVNISQCLIGCSGGEFGDSLGNSGRGLWHVAAGYSQKFTDKIKGEANVGYLAAVKTYTGVDDDLTTLRSARKKDMGTEVNARVDYSIQKGLTFSLAGAYLWLGDYDQNDAGLAEFNDGYYMGFMRLNYSF